MGTLAPILLAACGNPLACDDAFGPLVARRVAQAAVPQLEVVDLALNPAGLLHCIQGRRALIVVDAAVVPDVAPGKVLDLDYRSAQRPQLLSDRTWSTHGLGLSSQLAMAESLGWLPPNVRLIVLTVQTPALGLPLSAQAAAAVPRAVETILAWVQRWRDDSLAPDPGPSDPGLPGNTEENHVQRIES
ncbi:MAG: hydrogenase maturation protease [Tepidisphaeraceae bacterium]